MKRITAVLLVVMMIITTLTPVGAIGFIGVEGSGEKTQGTTVETAKAALSAETAVVIGSGEVYSGVPEGATVDLGNTEAVYDSAAGTITGAGYAGTVTITSGEDVTKLRFSAPTKWKPGLNVLTGTALPYTADEAGDADFHAATFTTTGGNGVTGIRVDPADEANNTVALTASVTSNSYPEIITVANFAPTMETTRPMTVSLKYKGSVAQMWAMINGRSSSTDIFCEIHNGTAQTLADWKAFTKTATPAYAVKTVGVEGLASSTKIVYLDDISFIPSYKISYADDSTGEVTSYTYDYALLGTDGNILTEYTPKKDNYPAYYDDGNGSILKCIGWSTTEFDDTPMTAIPLENKDVTLYPVWADYEIFDFKTAVLDANSTLNLTVVDTNAEFTFDKGYSEAVLDTTNHTLTGAGYAGVVTITGKSGDVTETKTVYLVNATKWKPGLNILTGTEGAMDFDNEVIDEIYAAAFTTSGSNGLSGVAVDPDDESNKVLKIYGSATSNSYPEAITKSTLNPTIETARPLTSSLKYKGTVANMWTMINGRSSSTDIFKDVHDGTSAVVSSFVTFTYTGNPKYAVKAVGIEALASSTKLVYADT